MQNGTDQRNRDEKVALATGHLVAVTDDARKLGVLLNTFQEIVNGRINPTALIGPPMAETIEHYCLEIVGAIREAHEALDGGQAAGRPSQKAEKDAKE